jgi:hypothetical protein
MPAFTPPANHRQYATVVANVWGSGTRIGTVSLTTTAVSELKVGSSLALSGRHTLFAENDTSGLFYIKNTTTLTQADGFLVDSGTMATIKLDPTRIQKIYAIAFTGTVAPHVIEMRNSS